MDWTRTMVGAVRQRLAKLVKQKPEDQKPKRWTHPPAGWPVVYRQFASREAPKRPPGSIV